MAQELRPLYLIAGSDRPKVELAVGRLRGRFDAAAVESLSAVESSGADAVAACNALGLFGSGHRLVLVHDAERWKSDDAKAVADTPTPTLSCAEIVPSSAPTRSAHIPRGLSPFRSV